MSPRRRVCLRAWISFLSEFRLCVCYGSDMVSLKRSELAGVIRRPVQIWVTACLWSVIVRHELSPYNGPLCLTEGRLGSNSKENACQLHSQTTGELSKHKGRYIEETVTRVRTVADSCQWRHVTQMFIYDNIPSNVNINRSHHILMIPVKNITV